MPFVNLYLPASARMTPNAEADLEFRIAHAVGAAVKPVAEAAGIKLGPGEVTAYFFYEDERPSVIHGEKRRDVWGEVCTGMIGRMADDAIRQMTGLVTDLVFIALGGMHFVEIFPRVLDGKNVGRRKPEPPEEFSPMHP
ncbi:MAG: hypothetical protein A2Z96_03695 [Spirochaetes bacterium GWB1_48_6]|nr:MAG: hypothetical protein UX14_C0024G0003 [Parcubacteria group bacterium GW2011_GWF1_45_5]OHD12222.1 MAG: hypothetical protein A2Z96_03695 [Spirochaetes bacterium GWB1_48_6]